MPTIVHAFIELIQETPGHITSLLRAILRFFRALGRGMLWLFSSPLGFCLANVATVIGGLIAVVQYQFFEQLPETTAAICGNHPSGEAWSNLLSYRDQVAFVSIDYNETCEPIHKPNLQFIKLQSDSIFLVFKFPQLLVPEEFYNVGIFNPDQKYLDENPYPYHIRLSQGLDKPEPKAEEIRHFQRARPYIIKMDQNDQAISLTLVPAPDNDKLKRQNLCREKQWSSWVKPLLCPFIPLMAHAD
jgi:hypothetical protein